MVKAKEQAQERAEIGAVESLSLVYDKWPDHFREASRFGCNIDHEREFYSSAVFCGMGGSATSCDILNELMLSSSPIPSLSIKGREIPAFVNKHTLVIVNSVSGNTEEAISMAKASHAKGAEVIYISNGGMLADLASSFGARHISIPKLLMPRATLPYLIMPSLNIVKPFINQQDNLSDSICESLDRARKIIASNVSADNNIAKQISSFMRGGLSFCFTSPSLYCAGNRFKNSLNENAKLFCFRESLLEASHNEIVPFTFNYDADSKVLLLSWISDEMMVRQRFEKIKLLFREIGQPTMELNVSESSFINAILSSIYILDYSTIYMAAARKVDPSPTPAIDILKKLEPEWGS